MSSAVLVVLGLLGGGFAWGRLRLPGTGPGIRAAGLTLVAAIGLLVGVILLAKLFQSDVLGWVFGLGLVLLCALLPCALPWWMGAALGAAARRRHTAPAANY